MSRIGKLPITVPSGVNVDVQEDAVKVKGPKGELSQHILSNVVDVRLENGAVRVSGPEVRHPVEVSVAINPLNPDHVIAVSTQNRRRGEGTSGSSKVHGSACLAVRHLGSITCIYKDARTVPPLFR